MSITIDLRMLNSSGIGTYIRNLIPIIIKNNPDWNFNLFIHPGDVLNIHTDNINFIECESNIYSRKEQIELPRKIPKDTEILWVPHYNIPLFYKGKLVVTVHDVFHLAMPNYVGGFHKKLYAKFMFSAVRQKADAILCVSSFTLKELSRFTGQGRQKVNVIYNGVDNVWYNIIKNQRPYPKPYLLFVGNVKPHKNISALLEAFQLIMHELNIDLVIVGKKEGFITEDKCVAEKAKLLEDRVYFTGFVNDTELKQFYIHAEALVFPSLYEGFGLPPLEAMACGCPVIVSNVASLPEVCGDAVLYCDPNDSRDIAAKIIKICSDYQLKNVLVINGKTRAKQFTWERSAIETTNILKEVYHR